MENSYRFFANKECSYYPCHEGITECNCLFCFCPFYLKEKCPGKPLFLKKEDRIVKDCTYCTYPHEPEHYDVIMNWIKKENQKRIVSEETMKKAVPFEKRKEAGAAIIADQKREK